MNAGNKRLLLNCLGPLLVLVGGYLAAKVAGGQTLHDKSLIALGAIAVAIGIARTLVGIRRKISNEIDPRKREESEAELEEVTSTADWVTGPSRGPMVLVILCVFSAGLAVVGIAVGEGLIAVTGTALLVASSIVWGLTKKAQMERAHSFSQIKGFRLEITPDGFIYEAMPKLSGKTPQARREELATNTKTMRIKVNRGFPARLSKTSIQKWDPPFDTEEIDGKTKEKILAHIVEFRRR